MQAAHYFYREGSFFQNGYTLWMYRYGEMLGFVFGGLCFVAFLLSFVRSKWWRWRRGAIACGMVMVIGAGLLTNSVLKAYWGRPRPKQLEAFGGRHAFRPFYLPQGPQKEDPQKSFPSGHVAQGFSYLSLCFVGRRYRSRGLFWSGVALSLAMGGGLMFVRVAQGGHFLSDVLFSLILMWTTAWGVDRFLFTSEGWVGHRLLGPMPHGTSPAQPRPSEA